MGRPRRNAHTIATPERILRAAVTEFGRVGYESARLEDIAKRAGIQRPAVLYHYPSKKKLYEAVGQRIFEELTQLMLGAFSLGGDIEERLTHVVRLLNEHFEKRPALARIFLREVASQGATSQRAARDIAAPMLDVLEETIIREAGPRLRPGIPVRSALYHIWSNMLFFHASGPIGQAIWKGNQSETVARMLLLTDKPSKK